VREEELLQAAESGDVAKLKTIVRGRDFNTDYTDQLGRTPLHLAVVNDHKEVGVVAARAIQFNSIQSIVGCIFVE